LIEGPNPGFGTGTIIAGQLSQGGGPASDTTTRTELGGSLSLTVTGSMTVGGLGDYSFTIDKDATLIGGGNSTIYEGITNDDGKPPPGMGIITGDGTLQNGSSSDTTATMTFTYDSSLMNDSPASPGNTPVATFVNYGNVDCATTTAGMILAGGNDTVAVGTRVTPRPPHREGAGFVETVFRLR
jgi:hypothetical protein